MNFVKTAYVRNPHNLQLRVNAHFDSGKTKSFSFSDKELKVKNEICSKKMVAVDPVKSIEIICEEEDYHETHEMDEVEGIEDRSYSVSQDNLGNTCVLMATK